MNRQPIQDNKALIKTLQEYSRVGLIYAKVDFRKEEEAAFWGQVEDVEEEGIARYRVKGFRLWHVDEVFNTEDDLIKGDLIIPPIGDCDLILHEGARPGSRPVEVYMDDREFLQRMKMLYPFIRVNIPKGYTLDTVLKEMLE